MKQAAEIATLLGVPCIFAPEEADSQCAYLSINNISVSIDNGQPQLSAANANQLYDISKESGLSMSRQAFLGQALNTSLNASDPTNNPILAGCGSVLILEPSQLGIRSGLAQGSVGKFIFQVLNISLTNNTGADLSNVTLYVIAVTNAVLHRRGTEYTNYLLNAPDNITQISRHLPVVRNSEYQNALNRNAFLRGSGVKYFFRKALDVAKKGVRYLANNPELVQKGLKALSGGRKPKSRRGGEVQPPHDMDLFFE